MWKLQCLDALNLSEPTGHPWCFHLPPRRVKQNPTKNINHEWPWAFLNSLPWNKKSSTDIFDDFLEFRNGYCNSYLAHHSSNSVPSTSTPPVRETSHLPTAVGELMVTKDDLGWWSLYGIFYVTYNYLLAYSYMYINACLFTSIILIVLVFICQFIMFLFFIWAADWYLVLTARADSSRGFTSRADQRPSRLTWFGVSHA